VLAIDAGGTGTRAELRNRDGTLLGRAQAGPGNLFQNREGALAATLAAWRGCCAAAGLDPDRAGPATCMSAGYAGLSAPGAAADVRAACAAFAAVRLSSDAYTALIGAFEGAPGALMVIGTGTAGAVLDASGRVRQLGGWGFPAGDGGSGAWIGLQLAGAWLDWRDGIGEASLLWPSITAALPDDRAALLHWMRTARSAEYGALARFVPDALAAGDPVARDVVERATTLLLRLARGLTAEPGIRLALIGGLAPLFAPRLDAALGPGILALDRPPSALHGAFLIGTGRAAAEFPPACAATSDIGPNPSP
jgi:glucosamine kinase